MHRQSKIRRHRRTVAALVAFAVATVALPAVAAAAPVGKIYVVKADADELALLIRVEPAPAQSILECRETGGELGGAEELIPVRGIGERTFELLEHFLSPEEETTLTGKLSTAVTRQARAGGSGDDG